MGSMKNLWRGLTENLMNGDESARQPLIDLGASEALLGIDGTHGAIREYYGCGFSTLVVVSSAVPIR